VKKNADVRVLQAPEVRHWNSHTVAQLLRPLEGASNRRHVLVYWHCASFSLTSHLLIVKLLYTVHFSVHRVNYDPVV
jgi:hypothetical protein